MKQKLKDERESNHLEKWKVWNKNSNVNEREEVLCLLHGFFYKFRTE